MDILEWAQSQNFDNNHMVRKLAGKTQFDGPNELDLELAKRTVKDRFIVGLMNEFEESIHRFNAVMGIDESEKQGKCMKRFFVKGKKSNSNPHPEVELGSPAWELLAQMNALDIKLYEYAVRLFEEQKMLFVNSRDDVEKGRRPVNAISAANDAKRLSARIKREEARRLKREQRYAASLARPK
ncbi:hypothetical protein ACHAW5_003092 [Stephanodiscus triporus]|uniref:Uncharacterized protein n=1 Tax=Stephanodiscus triporus TaxID=2934178 RepID=A0ABD3MC33_9STRA